MKRIRLKKILKYFLIIVITLLIITIVPILLYKKQENNTPLPWYYKKGVYHIHSTFSDGTGNLQEITRAASSLDYDFVILTDHGRPNEECAKSTAYYSDVLLIGGSEFSLNCGHLAAVGFKIPTYIFPPEPQEAINEVIADKGICFISHPYDRIAWTDWDIKNFTGIEVLSASSCAGKISILQFLAFLVQYPFSANYALLNTLKYPEQNIEKWKSLNTAGKYYGIYALDAHAKLALSRNIQFHFPSYKAMFEILTVYVKIDKQLVNDPIESASIIISSIKKGNFFNVIEAIAPANGFEAYFIQEDGSRVEMGGSTGSERGLIKILLPFAFKTDIVVRRDGILYKKISENLKDNLEVDVNQSGVYFIEVYVSKNRFKKIPWILTNPFFINGNVPAEQKNEDKVEIGLKKLLVDKKDYFEIAASNGSQGNLSYEINKKNELVTKFGFHLQKNPGMKDFWACLVRREGFDFSGFEGLVFEAKSSEKKRFWVEIRTKDKDGETWYSHSFLSDREWKKIHIPFGRFHLVYSVKKMPELSKISSIFFTINNGNAYAGTEGTLELKNIGLY